MVMLMYVIKQFFDGSCARMKISVSMDISVLGFYGYIRYIGGYFYMNIDISKIKLL